MKKFVLLVLASLIVSGVAILFHSGSLAKTALEDGVTSALGRDASVDNVAISPFNGDLRFRNLSVSNPQGFHDSPFLFVSSGHMRAELQTLPRKLVQVETLELDTLFLSLERTSKNSNYAGILDNLKRVMAVGGDRTSKRFVIKSLVCRHISARLEWTPANGELISLDVIVPELRLKNVGAGFGCNLSQITDLLVRELSRAALDQDFAHVPKPLKDDLRKRLGGRSGTVQPAPQEGPPKLTPEARDELRRNVEQSERALGTATHGNF